MKPIYFVPVAMGVLTCGILAQGAPNPEFMIPVLREPHHFVKLDNPLVRVLDVTVPAFDSTLYHIHENPYFWISIGDADLRLLAVGTPGIATVAPKDGEVRYSPVTTHRVGNVAATPFRNITVQIQARDTVSPGTSFLATPRPAGYQGAPALENDLVRVERLILEPGQSTGRYALPKSGILIAGHDGTISIEVQGGAARRMQMKAGDFEWHTGPETHTITNVGPARFDAIEAVWK